MEEHIKLHNIYLFQCVYCDYGTTATAKIMEHVADEHPERMLFYHTRVSRVRDPKIRQPYGLHEDIEEALKAIVTRLLLDNTEQ